MYYSIYGNFSVHTSLVNKKKNSILIPAAFCVTFDALPIFLEMKKYFQKWAWIFTPYQSQASANYHAGLNLVYEVMDECKTYKHALFTYEMLWGVLVRKHPELTRQHVQRTVDLLQSLNVLGDCGVVRQGSNHMRVLRNVG